MPAPAASSEFRLVLLSVLLLEGGIFLALTAWLWGARHFPPFATPVALHPLFRALCSALGVIDIWAACDMLAERIVPDPAPDSPAAPPHRSLP